MAHHGSDWRGVMGRVYSKTEAPDAVIIDGHQGRSLGHLYRFEDGRVDVPPAGEMAGGQTV